MAMGLENPWQITPSHISERQNSARSDTIDRIYTFLEPGELLEDGYGTSYRRYWDAAQAGSFREVQKNL